MCAATATNEQSISREELSLWIEQYHDGTIAEDAARKLGALIHARNEVAGWIVQELEFAGLLAQALHDVDRESFVRAFVERLASEAGPDMSRDIARSATAQVQAARLEQHRPPTFGEHIATLINGVSSQLTAATASDGRRRWRTGRIAALVLILGAVTAGAAWVYLAPIKVASLREYSNGVVILRGNTRLLPAGGMSLRQGDTITIPRGGSATAQCGKFFEISLLDDASATLQATNDDAPQVSLMRGKLAVDGLAQAPAGLAVSTPHARILVSTGSAVITATTSSTRIENNSAEAVVTRLGDAAQLQLPAHHHAIIGPGAPLEALSQN